MQDSNIMSYVALAIIVAVGIFGVMIYNSMIKARNEYKNAFSQIDVQLTRRHDLIPNLVATTKKYLEHEKETLTAVIEARNGAASALSQAKADPNSENLGVLSAAEGLLSQKMGSFFALMESYPDLKANQSIAELNEELSSTENKVAFARQHFNDMITDFNNKITVFPNNLIANFFGFKESQLLEIDNIEAKRENIKVDLG